jgi:hypothetical protein
MKSNIYKIKIWWPWGRGFWFTHKRYKSEQQARQAFSVLTKKKDNQRKSKLKWKDEHNKFRLIFPDGSIIER